MYGNPTERDAEYCGMHMLATMILNNDAFGELLASVTSILREYVSVKPHDAAALTGGERFACGCCVLPSCWAAEFY